MTSADVPDKVLDLISKLAALAHDSGATENEAHVAMQKMQELLFRYNLSVADFEIRKGKKPSSSVGEDYNRTWERSNRKPGSGFKERSGRYQPYEREWRVKLGIAIARYNFCRTMTTHDFNAIWFVGAPANVEAVKSIWEWACEQIDRLSYEALKSRRSDKVQQALEGFVSGKTWRKDWLFGCVDRVTQRLYDQWRELSRQTEQTKALVLSNDAALEEYIEGRINKKAKGIKFSDNHYGSGYTHGYKAGDKVSISRPASRIED